MDTLLLPNFGPRYHLYHLFCVAEHFARRGTQTRFGEANLEDIFLCQNEAPHLRQSGQGQDIAAKILVVFPVNSSRALLAINLRSQRALLAVAAYIDKDLWQLGHPSYHVKQCETYEHDRLVAVLPTLASNNVSTLAGQRPEKSYIDI